jgi:pyruvate formate lyase activating enzyme
VVFDIQRFCVHDGPGIRTVVFFKGCSLACAWCHNPEAVAGGPEIAYHAERCVPGCVACLPSCPERAIRDDPRRRVDFTRCDACGACVAACPSGCFVLIGRSMSVDEVEREVCRDRAFYEASGGGVTLSGGEPVLQVPFLLQLLPRLRSAGIHVAVETAASVAYELLERLLGYFDLWLFDVKLIDASRHEKLTGRANERILANLRRLVSAGAPVSVRMPVVPGVNTDEENVGRTAELLCGLGIETLTLLPYNALWEAKLAHLATARTPLGVRPASAEYYESLQNAFAIQGVRAHVEG